MAFESINITLGQALKNTFLAHLTRTLPATFLLRPQNPEIDTGFLQNIHRGQCDPSGPFIISRGTTGVIKKFSARREGLQAKALCPVCSLLQQPTPWIPRTRNTTHYNLYGLGGNPPLTSDSPQCLEDIYNLHTAGASFHTSATGGTKPDFFALKVQQADL